MKEAYSIVLGTVITERSTDLQDHQNKYTFRVHPRATKIDIKRAVEQIFKVQVEQVNTIRVPGKLRRVRVQPGYTSSWKKAVVTLRKGDSIDFA
jgi:large subunit ribosomal protein L23